MPPGTADTRDEHLPRYRAVRSDLVRLEPLDGGLTAAFHRSSGITHLLVEPAPGLLTVLADAWLTQAELFERLAASFDLEGADRAALAARLDELAAAGLVEAVRA